MALIVRIGRREFWIVAEKRWPFVIQAGMDHDSDRHDQAGRPWGLGVWIEVY